MTKVDRTRLPDLGQESQFTFPVIQSHRLSNGLNLRTVEHRSVPVITFHLQVWAGLGFDPSGLAGLAGITADMLDEGTGKLSALEISEALADIGAGFNIDVGPDVTNVSLTTLTRFADEGATLLADLVTCPSLRDEDFKRVRQLRLDRLRQLNDIPPAVAERVFLRLLYQNHPYGHLAIGSDQTLRVMQLEDVQQFHLQRYRPENATLIVVGAESNSTLLAITERTFGQWQPRNSSAIKRRRPPDSRNLTSAVRLAVVPRDQAPQSHVRIGQLSANRNSPDYPAIVVMNRILGGDFVSRINLKLREDKGYTYGARTGFDWRCGPAPFSLEVAVDSTVTIDAIQESIFELNAIRGSQPTTNKELMSAKASLTRGYPRNFETARSIAHGVAQLTQYDLPDKYFEEFVPSVSAVEIDDVTQVANTYLQPDQLITLIVGDQKLIASSVESLGLGKPVVLSPEGLTS